MTAEEKESMRKMVDALKGGARMLSDVCPVCGNPLFDVEGELRCVVCGKPVVKVRDEDSVERAILPYLLRRLDVVLVNKLEELSIRLSKAMETDEIYSLCRAIDYVLTLIQKNDAIKSGEGGSKN
ncbi:MAG: hypothetical protein NZ920_01190 [Aigarchaeota archaeon]|nr:hypothetical protein [Aigarchaeota archaeon]